MNSAKLIETKEKTQKETGVLFCWKDSPSIQRLLDTISSIIAEEYVQITKNNPELFTTQGGSK
jgi:hypothetical protein